MTNREFWNACQATNWQFENSEQHETWLAGTEAMKRLVSKIQNDPKKQNIYDDFHAYNFSGPAYGTPKASKPVKPDAVSEIAVDNLIAKLESE